MKNVDKIIQYAFVFIVILCFCSIVFISGYILGVQQKTEKELPQSFEEPKKVLQPGEIFSVYGTIDKIEGKKIILTVPANDIYSTPERQLTVLISEKTKFYKIITKDQDIFITESQNNQEPVSPVDKQEIAFSDLQIGDKIKVICGEDISDQQTIEPLHINLF